MGRRGGRGGGGRGGYVRRDDRSGGARDDRGTRDRRPDDMDTRDRRPDDRGTRDRRPDGRGMRDNRPDDYRRRRSPRSPSPDRRPHRSPSPIRRPHCSPLPDRRPRRSPSPDYRSRRPRDDDGERDLPRGGQGEYGRVAPYRQERDRHDHPGRGDCGSNGSYDDRRPRGRFDGRAASGRYDGPPDYMLPEHLSNLRAAEKKSEFFGGPGGRNINKDSEFYGDAGMALRVCSTGMGRTSSLYLDGRSPPLPPSPPISPPPRYPSVPLTETGFLTGGTTMNSGESFGTGSTRLPHDNSGFQYRDRLRGSYVGSREIERLDPGRDVLIERDAQMDRFQYRDRLRGSYVGSREIERHDPGRDVLIERDAQMDRLYPSRGMFDSDIGPSMQLKGYAGSSSSVLAKDHPYRVHGEGYGPSNGHIMDAIGIPPHDSLGHGGGHDNRLSEISLDHGSGHDDKIPVDITRQTHSKHPPRSASVEYDTDGYGRRGPENESYLASRNLYGNDSQDSRASIRRTFGSSPLTGLKDERNNHQVRLSRRMAEDGDAMEYNVQHSYHGDTPTRYRKTRGAHVRYSRSPETDHLELARRPVRQHEFTSFEDGCQLSDQEVSPMPYRTSRGAAYSDCGMEIYQDDVPPGREYYTNYIDAYDLSPERMSRRSSDIVDDEDGYDARYDISTSRNVFSRIALPDTTNEEWIDADQGNHSHLNTLAHGRSKYKPISQRLSRPMVQPQFGGSSMPGKGRGGWTKSAKKRLRAGLPQLHGGYTLEKNEFVRPNKISKLSEDSHEGTESNHEDAPDEEDPLIQKDPPEGSQEFSRQVHQAFLKFSKILNESSAMQKKYREAPKGSLSCCVCGSVARRFPDIDALMAHAYDTRKAGLKTKHLGFHKALCVLMGWNWHVAPDTSKAYQSVPAEEVNAMKRDLMLWPPVVVIHNSSIANKAMPTEAKIVSKEEIQGLLADIGVAWGKAKVTQGRPANQSVFIVKFMPTISGFQEAMRIHKHFTIENHGKEEFQQIKGGKGKNAAPVDKLEELLYAHIAVAEDLGYLDDETKKRCVIRSKNDIEAKADATLNLDS